MCTILELVRLPGEFLFLLLCSVVLSILKLMEEKIMALRWQWYTQTLGAVDRLHNRKGPPA